jgi:F0F1-type ATP synthase membrane subunit b/b'
VQQGPKQPLATAAEQRRERDKRRKRHDEEMLAQAERAGGIYIGGFPDRLRPEAERRLERARQRLDAERQAIRAEIDRQPVTP